MGDRGLEREPVLRAVLQAIRAAPSGHNTQPWQVLTGAGPRALGLGVAPARWLRHGDPEGEILAYSLGCALESACDVAHVEYEPELDEAPRDPKPVGWLHVRRLRDDCGERARLQALRCTHRGRFSRREPSGEALRELEAAARAHGVEVHVLSDRARIRQLGRLTADGAAANLRDPHYLSELLDWIRLSAREPAFAWDGFTPATLQLDPASRALIRWLKSSARARELLPRWGLARVMGQRAGSLLRASGALVLLAARDTSFQGRVATGRALLATWLAATRAGLAVQPVHFPLALAPSRAEVGRLFGAAAPPAQLLRVGRALGPAPRAGRLPLDQICAALKAEP